MANGTHDVTRRDFLKSAGVATAGVALVAGCGNEGGATPQASAPQAAAQAAAPLVQVSIDTAMPKKRLGKTNAEVSVLGFGSAHHITPILLNRALESGVTYLDTAEGYNNGMSETRIGQILAQNGKRGECFIITKTTDHTAGNLRAHLEGSLKRLQTDHVEVLYLHNLGNPDLLNAEMEQAAQKLIDEGLIKHFGFSSHHANMLACLERASEVGFVEVIMFKYNFRDYDNAELNRVMDKCHEADIGLVAMKTQGGAVSFTDRVNPFTQAGLSQEQAVLRAVYEDERITTIVSAMRNVEQVEQNSTAAKQPELTAMERRALEEYRLASSSMYCRGTCGATCMAQVSADTNIPDVMRHLMYYENYGDRRTARRLYKDLPTAQRAITGVDFAGAEAACPYGLPVGDMLRRADQMLV